MLDLYKGFSGFRRNYMYHKRRTESNSIWEIQVLAACLLFTGGEAEEDLEKAWVMSLVSVTMSNTIGKIGLKTNYKNVIEDDLELGYTVEAEKEIAVEADFAKNFINDYLVPRFDTSRSMDEFVEYLDVRQEEQNPFQTQDIVNAVQQVAQLRSEAYLDQLKGTADRSFNADFYFNPTGDDARIDEYADTEKRSYLVIGKSSHRKKKRIGLARISLWFRH